MVTGKVGKVMSSVVGFAIVDSLLVLFICDWYIYRYLIIGRFAAINDEFYTLFLYWQQKRLAIASLLYINIIMG